ncbi:hypothetical protein [Blastococcus xanthinilyticus]|uniref:Uncharacterized protein n=1 Tax=Blastococcus xanthinilyticus TaxID=1564164 RepID=A0A5S5CW36_9ACTN|nr:hypothetical protein [Blastococcus xanthinilyticus]TYP87198.1 hypothetical protein BD833_107138 [Blastococcus xanthinilyticus]
MTTLALVASAWVALALPVGVLLGRGIRTADQREQVAGSPVPDFIPAEVVASVAAGQHPRG